MREREKEKSARTWERETPDMSFFGFPSHIVYYAVLIKGPC